MLKTGTFPKNLANFSESIVADVMMSLKSFRLQQSWQSQGKHLRARTKSPPRKCADIPMSFWGILKAPPLPPTLWWGRCPLGVDMTLREEILEGQNWGPWWFSGPGTFEKRFPVKNDVE